MDNKSSYLKRPIVFLVDDDSLLLNTLSRAVEKHHYQVKSHSSAREFLDDFNGEHGCLVLDLSMPEMDGFELQTELKKLNYEIPLVFMTGHGGVTDSVTALRGGAIDFLEKPFRTETLLASIEDAIALDAANREASLEKNEMREKLASLTDRERDIFDLLTQGDEAPSSKAMARTLDISHRTVEHHRSRILEKLGVGSVVELRLTIDRP